jgi:hypothetical protein
METTQDELLSGDMKNCPHVASPIDVTEIGRSPERIVPEVHQGPDAMSKTARAIAAILALLALSIGAVGVPKSGAVTMVRGIDNVGICATDLTKSVAFYHRLGFSEAYRNDRGVMMAAGTTQLFLFAARQPNPPPVRRDLGLFGNPPARMVGLEDPDGNNLYLLQNSKCDSCRYALPAHLQVGISWTHLAPASQWQTRFETASHCT